MLFLSCGQTQKVETTIFEIRKKITDQKTQGHKTTSRVTQDTTIVNVINLLKTDIQYEKWVDFEIKCG